MIFSVFIKAVIDGYGIKCDLIISTFKFEEPTSILSNNILQLCNQLIKNIILNVSSNSCFRKI